MILTADQSETSLVGTESGLERSTHDEFLCWLEQEGIIGPETGVNPVPPSINESKLKGIPEVGVVIGIPGPSFVTGFLDANVVTGSDVGRARAPPKHGFFGAGITEDVSCFI